MPNKRIRTLSLFSGAGGLDIGFHRAGFDIVASVEIEAQFCRTLRINSDIGDHLSPDGTIHEGDVRTFDATPYADIGIECVIGGPPCQTFSAAGRRAGGVIGTQDETGQLFLAYRRVLEVVRPKVFVFENVYGLPGANGGKSWALVKEAFQSLGYQVQAEILDTADYGVPQHRERFIVVGLKSGSFTFPLPTHGPDSPSGQPLVSVESAIADLQDPKEPVHEGLGGLYGHLLPQIPEGLNYSYFTTEMGHPTPVFAWRSKFHDLLYKVKRDEPSRTIKANPGKFTGPFHWKNRHFTVLEYMRLQTFPDDYVLSGSAVAALKQIGNSVPPRFATVLAASVREQLFGAPKENLAYAVRPTGFKSTFRQRQRQRSLKFKVTAQAAFKQQKLRPSRAVKPELESYQFEAHSLFDRRRTMAHTGGTNPKINNGNSRQYYVSVQTFGSTISLDFGRVGAQPNRQSVIQISGLDHYLPGYRTLSATASLAELPDLFHLWGTIEDILVSRSQFFTLIDIYGHYANRGAYVNITSNLHLRRKRDPFLRILNYFAQTANCGTSVSESTLMEVLRFNETTLTQAVERLRQIRVDVRTSITHPILGPGQVLCTYPFPMLSPRAFVESKAVFNPILSEVTEEVMT